MTARVSIDAPNFMPARSRVGLPALVVLGILVGVSAIALRLPSCAESFWVDELHSAWVVEDSLGDVTQRARLGHQTPLYFVALWGWKQVCGGSEVALRISSVLAVAFAGVVLAWGLARQTGCWSAGLAAGMVLAVEQNSIFFGTELRPYAAVIFFSACAVVCFARLIETEHRSDQFPVWVALLASVAVAAFVQPTSAGVLVWLPLLLLFRWLQHDWRSFLRVTFRDLLTVIAIVAAGAAIWRLTLADTYQQRQLWSTFGRTRSLGEIWQLWDWIPLLVLPLAVIIISQNVCHKRRQTPVAGKQPSGYFAQQVSDSCCRADTFFSLAGVVFVSVVGFWAAAYFEWLPIWHRRYLIATLPLLAGLVGLSVAAIAVAARSKPRWICLPSAIAVALIAGLAANQRLLPALARLPSPIVRRGEDWRGAVAWINRHAAPEDVVLVDAGLIEARAYLGDGAIPADSTKVTQMRYLCYPVLGPYQLSAAIRVGPVTSDLVPLDQLRQLAQLTAEPDRGVVVPLSPRPHAIWIVARRPIEALAETVKSVTARSPHPGGWEQAELRDFDGVSLLRVVAPEHVPTVKALPR